MTRALRERFCTNGFRRKILDGRLLPAGFLLLGATLTACGKKGPPLAPLRLVPEAPTEVVLRRVDDKAVIKLTLPTKNANGPGKVDLDRVEVYAVTAAPGAVVPPNRELMTKKFLVGSIPVKPPPDPDQPPDPNAPEDKRPSPGDTVTFSEELTPDTLAPATLTPPREKTRRKPAPASATPAAPTPPPPPYPMRIYVLRGITRTDHGGNPAPRVQLPVVALPQPPTGLLTMFNEQGVLILWTPPPVDDPPVVSLLPLLPIELVLPPTMGDAEATRLETMALIAALPPAAPEAIANPFYASRPAPAAPAAPVVPVVASAAAVAPPLAFNVYDASGVQPLNTAPSPAGSFLHPVTEFGKEQCFAVRTVETVATVAIEGKPSAATCITPHDIFPPAAPTGLNAVAGPGAINLIWNANTEADLAGYLVLRGEVPGDTLQPLTPAPIRETTYRDATAKPGVRYVYVVVAVDTATPPNASARTARVEETAR